MSIVLRVNKGSALTYDEMDRNQSQFYYSSSLHNDQTQLRLHYTGSTVLTEGGTDYSPRYHTIPISTGDITIPAATAAGNNTEIQYNDSGVFGTDPLFVFDKTKNYLGIGTNNPLSRVHIVAETRHGAEIILQGLSAAYNPESAKAAIHIKEGSNTIGKIGRTITDEFNYDLFVQNQYIVNSTTKEYGKIRFAIKGNNNDENFTIGAFSYDNNIAKLGVGKNTINPDRNISVVGARGIGFSTTTDYSLASYISPLHSSNGLPSTQPVGSEIGAGLLISSPNTDDGGNIVVAINTDDNEKEGFNIIKSSKGIYTNSSVIASFQASGKVGINTNFPSDIGLTVAGNISGSGTLQVGTIVTGTANNTSALVATTSGLVQKIAAAPVPLGGIIMWSGTIANIPSGWSLCDGDNNTPDLRDKFIIGARVDSAGSAYTNVTGTNTQTGGSKNAVLIGHTHTATIHESGSHQHLTPAESAIPGTDVHFTIFNNLRAKQLGEPAGEHTHTITIDSTGRNAAGDSNISQTGINANLPPYYSLAFIMYVGS